MTTTMWTTADLTTKGSYARVVDPISGRTIANIPDDPCLLSPSAESQATARLIAAAPEMLDFIRVLNHVGSDEGYCICPANDGTTVDRFHATICVMARGLLARLTP